MVFIQANRHRQDLPQYSRSIAVKLPFPTNSSIELSKFAVQALKQIFKEGCAYKKAGVIVQDRSDECAFWTAKNSFGFPRYQASLENEAAKIITALHHKIE